MYKQVGRLVRRQVDRQFDRHARISIAIFEPAVGRLQKLLSFEE